MHAAQNQAGENEQSDNARVALQQPSGSGCHDRAAAVAPDDAPSLLHRPDDQASDDDFAEQCMSDDELNNYYEGGGPHFPLR